MKKKICKIISAVVTVLMIFTSIPVFASEPQTVTNWESKVSEELLEVMSTKSDTDLIPVYVWLNDIDHDVIHEAMIEEKGMNPAAYENEEIFQKEIVPEIEAKIVARVGYEKAHAKVENSAYVLNANGAYHDETMSLVDRAIQAKTNEYIMAKRSISKREHSALVDEFIEEHVNEDRKIIDAGRYITRVIVEATKEEIEYYASLSCVSDLSLYEVLQLTPTMSTTIDQVDAGYSGTKGTEYNNGNGLKGTGIKIGVIEADAGIFDSSSPHLSSIYGNRLFMKNDVIENMEDEPPVEVAVNDHATAVTSIIVGQPVTLNNVTYEGVVPLATVYQTPVTYHNFVIKAFQKMVDRGVTVINLSAGRSSSFDYLDYYDREIDRLIFETDVTFVAAAGNTGDLNGYIHSPGKAFNVITVGNVATQTSSTGVLSRPYEINQTSSYLEGLYFPNKPDISAPGTQIKVVKSTTGTDNFFTKYGDIISGTSLAAPIVTGIVAQMHQAGGLSFITSPGMTKSVLITAADRAAIRTPDSVVPDTDNYYMGGFLWDKSGAGLVNAVQAVDLTQLQSQHIYGTCYSEGYTYTSGGYYFTAGQHLRATLVFEKEHNKMIPESIDPAAVDSYFDDLDLYLIDENGSEIFENVSRYDNVIIIEGNIQNSGYYRFKIVAENLVLISNYDGDDISDTDNHVYDGVPFYCSWYVE